METMRFLTLYSSFAVLLFHKVSGESCGENIVSESGILSSPNFPDNYPPDALCTWRITVPANYRVVLKFKSFELESSGICNFDYVLVYDGPDSSSPLLDRLCGQNKPDDVISSGNIMTVLFKTDFSVSSAGFVASFSKAPTSKNVCSSKSSKWSDLGGEFCYLIEKDRAVPWIDAVYNCYNEGGTLTSFHSRGEVQRVLQQINDESKRYYIGLWKHYDGSLEWVDKSDLGFRNWDFGEPNLVDEKCVEMYYNTGKWNDAQCSTEMGYICSSPKSEHPVVPTKVCPYNSLEWKDFGGETCYIINTAERLTWTNAMSRCSEEGGSLASFHSIEEISAVVQSIRASDRGLHIGLRKGENGKYLWVDGSPQNLDYWTSGEPNTAERICTEMSPQNGEWDAIPCEKVSGYTCSIPKDFCGGDIYSDAGSIHSPLYPLYAGKNNCTWKITVPEGQQVALQFQSFGLESSRGCRFDFVEVLDGHESGSPVIGRFCGQVIPPVLRSSGNTMTLRFVSDSINDGTGFLARFTKADVCGEDIVGSSGVLQSPNHPERYGPGVKCVWHITLPENDTVDLRFTNFGVESTTNCTSDFVQVHDGHDITSPVLGRFCGTNIPRKVRSTGNEMAVLFASDTSVESFGFSAKFERSCGGDIVSERGVISSPNYPDNYDADSSCTWKITVPEDHQVVLQFETFDVNWSLNCTSDFVEIRDGYESDGKLVAKACDRDLHHTYRSSTNKMAVTFVSDSSYEATGFTAAFAKVKPCGENISAERGIIHSPNFPNNYGPGLQCFWNIEVPENYRVSLKFTNYDVQEGISDRDFVIVQDGIQTADTILGGFSGNVIPDSIISTGNKMTIAFLSNLWEEKTGFSAEFQKDTCGGDIIAENGIISSPNYPEHYRRNEACTWRITVPLWSQVVLKFQSFDLENGVRNGEDDCIFDFVEIRNGHDPVNPILGRFCGTDIPEEFRSSRNTMTVTFVSDLSLQKSGFNATFTKDSTRYENFESTLREQPSIVLQHKLNKTKINVLTKQKKKNRVSLLLSTLLKP